MSNGLMRRALLALLCGLPPLALPALAAQALPGPLAGGSASDVPVAVQVLRWHMLDENVSSLAFRSMDSLFTTRSVPRGGAVWTLPRADQPLDFSYEWQGRRHAAAEFPERTYTNALLVMKDGRIVHEAYRNNTHAGSRFIGWSMTKSVTAVLLGCALAEGRIESLEAPISRYLPELAGGGYEGVSIRQVMQMRSGVDYEERYDFANPGRAAANHISSLVRNTTRFADAARTLPRKHAPGSVFQYKTIDTAVLGWLVERVSGMGVAAYTARCLWEPLGAEADGFYIMDGEPGTGREFSGAGFNATLRDYARIGQMMLDGGVANGRRIVAADWVRESTRPTPGSANPIGGYALQWWTVGDGTRYAAVGLQGQFIYVDPATRTVVVKLSHFPPGDDGALAGETLAYLQAASAWKAR